MSAPTAPLGRLAGRRSVRRGFVVAAALLACAPRTNGASNSAAGAPRLDRVQPDTVALGKGEVPTLVLRGSGFVPGTTGPFGTGENVVRIGPATFARIAADSSGTTIRFAMPLSWTDTTFKGRPPSFTPGSYAVSVVTPAGTSNTRNLTMIP